MAQESKRVHTLVNNQRSMPVTNPEAINVDSLKDFLTNFLSTTLKLLNLLQWISSYLQNTPCDPTQRPLFLMSQLFLSLNLQWKKTQNLKNWMSYWKLLALSAVHTNPVEPD